ncbi:hypothetical protein LEP1GSC074_2249 [Leptospira noguchii str. Hook]|uniref:Uncharacterized protein n=1 Tax=Leptospira noguchii serovar Autumnalis str. ZUN142 TaxID=1085540 RepID=M6UIV9_9LEPT|nr:hypothetical protein LEP1GSC041_0917 [Leptospira noguchii str. 2006001870]EMI66955.1 hypothetical protein LEP1GSC072_1907 [Leptospira noguchii str. Bonito]EMO42761.1 hypothetical protein LEP1GSC186_0915 [Leptospira noguchii serovar Autumnalis str. ZUN142]EMS84679.1 hypothetical protein LEP1GSC074_2249 [Leptospira noguchii str. Hook]
MSKNFLKGMSSYNLEFVRKIVICESSHVILRTNLKVL